MPINYDMVLHCIINAFETFGATMSEDISGYYRSGTYNFTKLATIEKIYYINYGSHIMGKLIGHIGDVNYIDIDNENKYCLLLSINKGKSYNYVSLAKPTENDIIPEKMMKICKYKKKDGVGKEYTESYKKLNDNIYKKIKNHDKYSEIPEETKIKKVYEPFCNLVKGTLENEQSCAQKLYSHMFSPAKMIILKLMQRRYVIYNFNVKNNIESFQITSEEPNKLRLTFNNGAIFNLTLFSNSQEIKEHLSLKFHAKFLNINEIYAVDKGSVP